MHKKRLKFSFFSCFFFPDGVCFGVYRTIRRESEDARLAFDGSIFQFGFFVVLFLISLSDARVHVCLVVSDACCQSYTYVCILGPFIS